MYFVLYDRFLKSIGETYILESWNRTQRATDFDEIKITGAEIPQNANPFLVVINDKQGKQMFSGLASTPSIDDKTKKTSLSLKDYLTLLNSEIIIDWDSFTGTTVASLIDFVFKTWKNQIDVGLENIICNTLSITDIPLDTELYNFTGKENVLAYNLIADAINYYDLYNETKLNLKDKELTFYFKKANLNPLSIRLSDFGLNAIEKSFGDYNRASVYSSGFVKNQEWALTESNEIVKLANNQKTLTNIKLGEKIKSDDSYDYIEIKTYSQTIENKKIIYRNEVANVVFETPYYLIKCIKNGELSKQTNIELTGLNTETTLYINDDIIYPAKNRNFIAQEKTEQTNGENGETIEIKTDGINDAVYDAVMGLAGNRYQENIDLNAQQYKSIIDLTNIDFSYKINVYTNEGEYKILPVGEIETDSKGKHIVRLGHRIQELTQEF